MSKSEEIARFIKEAGGVATAAEIKAAGFLPGSISHAVASGLIDRLTRGVYCTPDIFEDDFSAISCRWKKCVFSHESALFLNGLSDRVPNIIDVTVPHGYNPACISQEYPGIRIHRVKPEVYEWGIVSLETPTGVAVQSYSAERAVADLMAQRKNESVDPQLVRDAIVCCFKKEDIDLSELSRISASLGVEDEFRMYLEVLG